MQFEKPYSTDSVAALRHELQLQFQPVGLKVDLLLADNIAANSEFNDLVVFKMKGACTMIPLPLGAMIDERGPLAMSYSTDGEVLHFGEVQCDRVRRSLERVLGRGSPDKSQFLFGAALGRVMAHEIYHMIADVKGHTRSGVTKTSLSAEELLDSKLSMSNSAKAAVEHRLVPVR
ncbi:MAG TPA: hypothetical protein VH369_05400 [Bryobacteraceae bacterium]